MSAIASKDTNEFSDLIVTSDELLGNREPSLQPISGFTNYDPAGHYGITRLIQATRSAYELYGFTDFHSAPLMRSQNLLAKGGVGKQIYGVSRLADGSLTNLAIPFDRTVPFAHNIATHMGNMSFPYRRYEIGYSFRGEHAQPGRFRAFYQADVDVVGPNLGLMNDFECLGAMIQALRNMDVGEFTMYLNHIVIAKSMIAHAGISKEKEPEVLRLIDKLDKLEASDVANQIKEIVPEIDGTVIDGLVEKFTFRSSPEEFTLDEAFPESSHQAVRDVKHLYGMLVGAGIEKDRLVLSPGMVRGLDYYTGIVFETFVDGLEGYGSVASGGRYDKLVDTFAGGETGIEGVGGSIGLTRLFYVLDQKGLINPEKRTTLAQVLVCMRTQDLFTQAAEAATWLRKEGVKTAVYTGDKKGIKKQLEYADKNGFPFAVMVMGDDAYVIKNLTQGPDVLASDKQIEVATVGGLFSAYTTLLRRK